MTATDLEQLEDQVLSWINACNPVSTTDLLEAHRGEFASLTGEALRRAVWNLVDRGLLQYDRFWRLSPVSLSTLAGSSQQKLRCGEASTPRS